MTDKKNRRGCYWGAFSLLFAATAVCIACHRLFIHFGGQIAAPELINGEMTDPTVGRCIYVFVAAVAFLVLTVFSSHLAGKGKEFAAYALGIPAGIFLWQSIGEDAWHFSVEGVHFVCLESITVLPLAIVFLLLLYYCARRRIMDWGVLCVLLAFSINWYGHYVLIGIYPIFASMVEKVLWCRFVGIVLGTIFIVAGFICGVIKSRSRKEMMLSAMMTYFGVGVMLFGIMD